MGITYWSGVATSAEEGHLLSGVGAGCQKTEVKLKWYVVLHDVQHVTFTETRSIVSKKIKKM